MDEFNNDFDFADADDKAYIRYICNQGFRALGYRKRFKVVNRRFQAYRLRPRRRRAMSPAGNQIVVYQDQNFGNLRREEENNIPIPQPSPRQPQPSPRQPQPPSPQSPPSPRQPQPSPPQSPPSRRQPQPSPPQNVGNQDQNVGNLRQEEEDNIPIPQSPHQPQLSPRQLQPSRRQSRASRRQVDNGLAIIPLNVFDQKNQVVIPAESFNPRPAQSSKATKKDKDPTYKPPTVTKRKYVGGEENDDGDSSGGSPDPNPDGRVNLVKDPINRAAPSVNLDDSDGSGSGAEDEMRPGQSHQDAFKKRKNVGDEKRDYEEGPSCKMAKFSDEDRHKDHGDRRELQQRLFLTFRDAAVTTCLFESLMALLPTPESPILISKLDKEVRKMMLSFCFNKIDVEKMRLVDSADMERLSALPGMSANFHLEYPDPVYLQMHLDTDNSLFNELRNRLLNDHKQRSTAITYPNKAADRSVDVSKQDLDVLLPNEKLSSPVLDFYLRYLEEHLHNENFFFVPTFLYSYAEQYAETKADAELKALQRRQSFKFFTKTSIFLPIHGFDHWTLAIISIVRNPEMKITVLHFDSITDHHDSDKIFETIACWLQADWTRVKEGEPEDIDDISHLISSYAVEPPQQPPGVDCGAFVLYYLHRFFKDVPDGVIADLPDGRPDISRFGKNIWFKAKEAVDFRREVLDILQKEFDKLQSDADSECEMLP